MPRVYIIQNESPNAFATGRNPKHGVVAVTTGIQRLLTERELRGVLGHEMGHVKNRDILTSSIVATVAGAISMIAQMLMWSSIFGGRRDNQNPHHELRILLAPSRDCAEGISRQWEYAADKTAPKFTKAPMRGIAPDQLPRGEGFRPWSLPAGSCVGATRQARSQCAAAGYSKLFTRTPTEERSARLQRALLERGSRPTHKSGQWPALVVCLHATLTHSRSFRLPLLMLEGPVTSRGAWYDVGVCTRWPVRWSFCTGADADLQMAPVIFWSLVSRRCLSEGRREHLRPDWKLAWSFLDMDIHIASPNVRYVRLALGGCKWKRSPGFRPGATGHRGPPLNESYACPEERLRRPHPVKVRAAPVPCQPNHGAVRHALN